MTPIYKSRTPKRCLKCRCVIVNAVVSQKFCKRPSCVANGKHQEKRGTGLGQMGMFQKKRQKFEWKNLPPVENEKVVRWHEPREYRPKVIRDKNLCPRCSSVLKPLDDRLCSWYWRDRARFMALQGENDIMLGDKAEKF